MTLRVQCTAPLDWSSGYEYALVAARRLVDAGVAVRLAIPSGGTDEERVRFTVDDLDLAGVVERLPAAGQGEADVHLLPAVAGGPWPALDDVLRRRLPVVATRIPAVLRHVRGATGTVLLVPARDPDAIAGALGRLVPVAARP